MTKLELTGSHTFLKCTDVSQEQMLTSDLRASGITRLRNLILCGNPLAQLSTTCGESLIVSLRFRGRAASASLSNTLSRGMYGFSRLLTGEWLILRAARQSIVK